MTRNNRIFYKQDQIYVLEVLKIDIFLNLQNINS